VYSEVVVDMSKIVQVNPNIWVVAPYQVYLCIDCSDGAVCQYVDTTSSDPYQFNLPDEFETYPSFSIKIIDAQGCVVCETYTWT
jgi:hypothetical protein